MSCFSVLFSDKQLSMLAVSALLEVRNKAEAKRRQQELIEEAEKEGRSTDDIKVSMLTVQYTKLSVIFVFDICRLVVSNNCLSIFYTF